MSGFRILPGGRNIFLSTGNMTRNTVKSSLRATILAIKLKTGEAGFTKDLTANAVVLIVKENHAGVSL
jgi:hypothetical protein